MQLLFIMFIVQDSVVVVVQLNNAYTHIHMHDLQRYAISQKKDQGPGMFFFFLFFFLGGGGILKEKNLMKFYILKGCGSFLRGIFHEYTF